MAAECSEGKTGHSQKNEVCFCLHAQKRCSQVHSLYFAVYLFSMYLCSLINCFVIWTCSFSSSETDMCICCSRNSWILEILRLGLILLWTEYIIFLDSLPFTKELLNICIYNISNEQTPHMVKECLIKKPPAANFFTFQNSVITRN